MIDAVDRIEVAFRGDISGVADLTWGQRSMLLTMAREESWLPMGGRTPCAPGTTIAGITEELRYGHGRYQSFRTLLQFDGDRPLQVVEASGTLQVDVYETDDPERTAADVEHAYRTANPDLAVEWPVRAGIVCRRGVPEWLVVIMPHMVTDAAGAAVMVAEAVARPSTPVTGTQPLDLVGWQRSPAGERQSNAALRHWEKHLQEGAGLPVRDWQASLPAAIRNRKAVFTSPVMAAAVPRVVARTGFDPAAVVSAAFMTAVREITGSDRVLVRHLVSNRFRPGLADVVTPVAQLGLVVADVSGPFDDVLGRVVRAQLAGHKHAYYDAARLHGLIGDVTTLCYNDRRNQILAPAAGFTGEGVLEWRAPSTGPVEPMFAHVDAAPDALVLTVDVDTAHVSEAETETCLRAMEATLIAAGLG